MTFKLAAQLLRQVKKTPKENILKFNNGSAYFILPLARLTIFYHDTAPGCAGLRQYLMSDAFSAFVKDNPSVEFIVEHERVKLPHVLAYYLHAGTNEERKIDLNNKQETEIAGILRELRDDSGQPRRRFRPQVISDTPAIRPIWSPFHLNDGGNMDDNSNSKCNQGANNPLIALQKIVAERKARDAESLTRSLGKLNLPEKQ